MCRLSKAALPNKKSGQDSSTNNKTSIFKQKNQSLHKIFPSYSNCDQNSINLNIEAADINTNTNRNINITTNSDINQNSIYSKSIDEATNNSSRVGCISRLIECDRDASITSTNSILNENRVVDLQHKHESLDLVATADKSKHFEFLNTSTDNSFNFKDVSDKKFHEGSSRWRVQQLNKLYKSGLRQNENMKKICWTQIYGIALSQARSFPSSAVSKDFGGTTKRAASSARNHIPVAPPVPGGFDYKVPESQPTSLSAVFCRSSSKERHAGTDQSQLVNGLGDLSTLTLDNIPSDKRWHRDSSSNDSSSASSDVAFQQYSQMSSSGFDAGFFSHFGGAGLYDQDGVLPGLSEFDLKKDRREVKFTPAGADAHYQGVGFPVFGPGTIAGSVSRLPKRSSANGSDPDTDSSSAKVQSGKSKHSELKLNGGTASAAASKSKMSSAVRSMRSLGRIWKQTSSSFGRKTVAKSKLAVAEMATGKAVSKKNHGGVGAAKDKSMNRLLFLQDSDEAAVVESEDGWESDTHSEIGAQVCDSNSISEQASKVFAKGGVEGVEGAKSVTQPDDRFADHNEVVSIAINFEDHADVFVGRTPSQDDVFSQSDIHTESSSQTASDVVAIDVDDHTVIHLDKVVESKSKERLLPQGRRDSVRWRTRDSVISFESDFGADSDQPKSSGSDEFAASDSPPRLVLDSETASVGASKKSSMLNGLPRNRRTFHDSGLSDTDEANELVARISIAGEWQRG